MIYMYDLFSEFEDLFGGLDAFMQPISYREAQKCPLCGHTWADFRRTGRFGCGECYKTFRAPVEETIKQIHTTSSHTGKIPSRSGEKLKTKRRLEELKAKLQDAVRNEDYETAAKLHKQIREIENNG